jgi:threonine dehydratase
MELEDARAFASRVQDLETVRQAADESHLIEVETPFEGDNSVLLKMENEQAVKSFKVRGAALAMSENLEELQESGVVANSGGNHSQGVAMAGRLLGMPVKIVMSQQVPILKQMRTVELGSPGNQLFHLDATAENLADSENKAREIAEKEGRYYLSPFDDEDVIRGAATLVPEIFQQLKESGKEWPHGVHVPVGGGGLISGIADVSAEQHYPFELFGHEIVNADSAARSFDKDSPVPIPGEPSKFAEGLAVPEIGGRPFERFKDGKIDSVYVMNLAEVGEAYEWYKEVVLPQLGVNVEDDAEMWRYLPEVSSMVAIAGLFKHLRQTRAEGETHVAVVTGGNTERQHAETAMEAWRTERHLRRTMLHPEQNPDRQKLAALQRRWEQEAETAGQNPAEE